ncbi:MAG: F-type H+-transporting ATPase subunit epsilon [Patescibacteria group bacterium]|jgi:F-type H+-transporting ATPase subunit epsilon|nr:F-type H+-transporting ATPase subunit epsilon [Patescibacteria group bacterium]
MSQKKLELKIVTPDSVIYESSDISYVTVPTGAGEITVLPDHIPLVSNIKTGQIKVGKDGDVFALAVSNGILEVQRESKVVILAERSEMAHLIDLNRAEEAYKRAADLREKIKDEEEVDDAKVKALIDKELNRIKVGSKWKK